MDITIRRKSTRPPSVPHVESLPCPEHDGNHELTNGGWATMCRWCGRSWADLDAAVRKGRR